MKIKIENLAGVLPKKNLISLSGPEFVWNAWVGANPDIKDKFIRYKINSVNQKKLNYKYII